MKIKIIEGDFLKQNLVLNNFKVYNCNKITIILYESNGKAGQKLGL